MRPHLIAALIVASLASSGLLACSPKAPEPTGAAATPAPSSGGAVRGDAEPSSADAGPKGRLAYLKREGGELALFVADADGGNSRKLYAYTHPTNSNVTHPRWSGDGAKIVFNRMTDGGWRRMEIPAEGGEPVFVEGEPDLVSHSTHADDLIAETDKLSVKNAAGEVVALWEPRTSRRGGKAPGPSEASWSPDRAAVAFHHCHIKLPMGDTCMVYVVGADGKPRAEFEGQSPVWAGSKYR